MKVSEKYTSTELSKISRISEYFALLHAWQDRVTISESILVLKE